MIKYSVTFSTNHKGVEKTKKEVKDLTIKLLTCAGIDGATLTQNFAGVWQGQTEDSYTLCILSDGDISDVIGGLALNLKLSLNQQSVLIEQSIIDAKFI